MVLAAIPSPSTGVLHLGPLPLRAYAGAIILGLVVAIVVTDRRLRERGQPAGTAADAALWAVPAGIIGARVYHVITSPEAFFGSRGDPVRIFQLWNGGLGIWGAIAGGAVGAWFACRARGVSFALFADAAAPGIALAQAIGRWGNWFNQELYGRPTGLPWALRIDPEHQSVRGTELYHPTFLYESLWNLGVAGLLLLVDRRRRLGRGKLFALYVAAYAIGRSWIEALRIDDAHTLLGIRVNNWVALALFVGAVAVLALYRAPVDPVVSPAAPATGSEDGGGGAAPTPPAGASGEGAGGTGASSVRAGAEAKEAQAGGPGEPSPGRQAQLGGADRSGA